MARLLSYNCISNVPWLLRKQLQGLGYSSTSDSLRPIAFGRSECEGYKLVKLAILHDNGFILSWGILFWYDFGASGEQGIQLYTRKSHRRQGYGSKIYHKLMKYRSNQDVDPTVCCTEDNWQLFKKCKHPDADSFADDGFDF